MDEIARLEKEAAAAEEQMKRGRQQPKDPVPFETNPAEVVQELSGIAQLLANASAKIKASSEINDQVVQLAIDFHRFVQRFEVAHEEDQALLQKSVNDTAGAIKDFIVYYQLDLETQAAHRQKESEFLDLAKKVLTRYL